MSYGAISGAPSRYGFIRWGQNFLPASVAEAGGEVVMFKADAAQTLLLGDVVYVSDAGEVSKSATNALYALTAGVVVGGAKTNYQAITDEGAVGVIECAAAGEDVLVQISGVALTKLAAGQTIVAPQIVGVGTTSGNVLTVATGFALGIALTDQATAAGVVYVLLRISPTIAAAPVVITLDSLSDVTITGGTPGDVLQLNAGGTAWVNVPMVAPILVTTPTSGDVLTYNGTVWEAVAP